MFAINPGRNTPINFIMSGVTVRFGRNTQPLAAPDFSFAGGGLDWYERLVDAFLVSAISRQAVSDTSTTPVRFVRRGLVVSGQGEWVTSGDTTHAHDPAPDACR